MTRPTTICWLMYCWNLFPLFILFEIRFKDKTMKIIQTCLAVIVNIASQSENRTNNYKKKTRANILSMHWKLPGSCLIILFNTNIECGVHTVSLGIVIIHSIQIHTHTHISVERRQWQIYLCPVISTNVK